MRSYHNISDYVRVCVNDCVVNGIEIKKGVWIHFPIYASHFDPEFFPEPDTYCPERFLKKNADQIFPYTWRPFGSGSRLCIGKRFALDQMKIFAAKFFSRFVVSTTPRSGLKLKKGVMCFLEYPECIVKIEGSYKQ